MANGKAWDSTTAAGSDHLMVLTWNAGAIDQSGRNDNILRILTGNQHVIILQEGWSQRVEEWTYSRAMKTQSSCCSSMRCIMGGSGLKGIIDTYDFRPIEGLNCVRRNTDSTTTPHAFYWFTWDIAWFHPVTKVILPRGEHNTYRITSIHYNDNSARKPDEARALLFDLIVLAIRDQHDYISCDLNQATNIFKECITDVADHFPDVLFSLICNNSEEICVVFIQHDYATSDRDYIIKKAAWNLENLTAHALGLESTDTNTHCTLMTTMRPYTRDPEPKPVHQTRRSIQGVIKQKRRRQAKWLENRAARFYAAEAQNQPQQPSTEEEEDEPRLPQDVTLSQTYTPPNIYVRDNISPLPPPASSQPLPTMLPRPPAAPPPCPLTPFAPLPRPDFPIPQIRPTMHHHRRT